MKSSTVFLAGLALSCAFTFGGCSKPDSAAGAASPGAGAEPAAAGEGSAATPSGAAAETLKVLQRSAEGTAAATIAAARESLANFKLPDLKAATTQQLSALATQALTQWTQAVGTPDPAVSTEVESVKTALAQQQPTTALASLTRLADYAKSIPGGEALLQSSKQLVSAWALKQGFEPAKISGLLGALQSGDYAGLATQAAGLFAQGGVSAEQKGLLKGVLDAFGLDATQAAGAVNAVKGLLGK